LNTRYKNELRSWTNCLPLDKHILRRLISGLIIIVIIIIKRKQESVHSGATFYTQAAFLTVPSFPLPRFQSPRVSTDQ